MLKRLEQAAWFALFGCLLAGFGYAVWSASHKVPSQQQSERTTKAQSASDKAPQFVVAAAETNPDQRSRQSADEKKNTLKDFILGFFEIKLTDALIAIFTGVLA